MQQLFNVSQGKNPLLTTDTYVSSLGRENAFPWGFQEYKVFLQMPEGDGSYWEMWLAATGSQVWLYQVSSNAARLFLWPRISFSMKWTDLLLSLSADDGTIPDVQVEFSCACYCCAQSAGQALFCSGAVPDTVIQGDPPFDRHVWQVWNAIWSCWQLRGWNRALQGPRSLNPLLLMTFRSLE